MSDINESDRRAQVQALATELRWLLTQLRDLSSVEQSADITSRIQQLQILIRNIINDMDSREEEMELVAEADDVEADDVAAEARATRRRSSVKSKKSSRRHKKSRKSRKSQK